MVYRRLAAALACVAGAIGLCLAAVAPASTLAAFEPWAASFVSPSTGFVLGGVGCRFSQGAQHPCDAVLMATHDGGASWTRLAAPHATIAPILTAGMPGPGVRGIAFANPRDGWLFGPGLWSTHDGGAHWTRVVPKQQVIDVVAAGGSAYAVVNSVFAVGAQTTPMLRSAIGSDDWQAVPSLAGTVFYGSPGLLVSSGATTWAGLIAAKQIRSSSAPTELWRSVAGGTWQRLGEPCGAYFFLMAATSPSDLVMLCGGPGHPRVASSTDGGVHIQQFAASTSVPGLASLAAPFGQTRALVASFPPLSVFAPRPEFTTSSLFVTRNDGRSWSRTIYHDAGVGFTGLQFVSPTDGWVIHGYPGAPADGLLHTTNAGATFTPVGF